MQTGSPSTRDGPPDAPAVDTPTVRITYGELAARVTALAGQMAAAGVGPGSRVLLALPNVPAAVVAGLAIHSLGATSVEVNREWGREIPVEGPGAERSAPCGRLRSGRPDLGSPRGRAHAGLALGRARGPAPALDAGGARASGGDGPPRRRTPRPGGGAGAASTRPGAPPRVAGTHPLHIREHREAARRGPDLSQHQRQHTIHRAVPRPGASRPRAPDTAPLLLLREERAPDAPLRWRVGLPRRPLRLPSRRAGVVGLRGLHRHRRRPPDVRGHPQAGGRVNAVHPSSPLHHPGGRGHGAGHHFLGATELPAGATLRHVRPDRGDRPALLPATGVRRGEEGDPSGSPSPESSSAS